MTHQHIEGTETGDGVHQPILAHLRALRLCFPRGLDTSASARGIRIGRKASLVAKYVYLDDWDPHELQQLLALVIVLLRYLNCGWMKEISQKRTNDPSGKRKPHWRTFVVRLLYFSTASASPACGSNGSVGCWRYAIKAGKPPFTASQRQANRDFHLPAKTPPWPSPALQSHQSASPT